MLKRIRLQLFGVFQITIAGKAAGFKRRKTESLVAYLALHEGPQSREKITALFWGDINDDNARRSMRVTLADARKTLGEDILTGGRDTLELNLNRNIEVDSKTLLRLLQNYKTAPDSDLLAAIELYRGDLLEGIYDEWVFPARERYRALFLEAHFSLIERFRAAGDYPRTIHLSESLLARDPRNETALQHLLFCLAANGERERAIQRFREIQKREDFEFSELTLKLMEGIRKQENASLPARLTNLPRPSTSFIGREDELNEIETLLTQSRLVTLLGAGGSGKTRLAVQAGDEVVHQYPGGAWWVDLSALTDASLVAQSVARVLGVQEQPNQDLLYLTAKRIAKQTMLLVLDNCEHLISACARCVEYLLAQCPQLTILATSREPLRVAGEAGWDAPTLPLPKADSNSKTLLSNESARLFIERGRIANNSFQLTENNAPYVVNICRTLDGIPLAIELAAALLRSMPVEEVSKRLNQRFEILHISDDKRPPRQQTLRALVDWSYNLLSTTEQIFFRRLGIFSGGWTFDAAVVVGGGYDADFIQEKLSAERSAFALPINPADIVLGLLDSLRRRSLVSASYRGEAPRYAMLETLREYALERLANAGELAAVRARHLSHTLAFAQEADKHIHGMADQIEWTERLAAEADNVRAALRWVLEEGNIDQGLALGSAMYRFWLVRSFYEEARHWLGRLTSHPRAQQPTAERGYALANYARSLRNSNRMDEAPAILAEAFGIFEALKDERGMAFVRYCEGSIHFNMGRFDAASKALLFALEYYRAESATPFVLANILALLGQIALGHHDFPRAYEYIRESFVISEAQDDLSTVAWCKLVMGDIAYSQDDHTLARRNYEESLEMYRPMNRIANIAYLLEALASLAYWRGEMDLARTLVEESIQFYDSEKGWSAFSRAYRAAIAQAQGDMKTAEAWFLRAVTPLSEVETVYRSVYLIKLADFSSASREIKTAVTLYSAALRIADNPAVVLFPPDHRAARAGIESARKLMSEADFKDAEQCAESLSFEETVRMVFPSV
jgi:predicted ATPase/DNA-binding SARP family transcriptional activator